MGDLKEIGKAKYKISMKNGFITDLLLFNMIVQEFLNFRC